MTIFGASRPNLIRHPGLVPGSTVPEGMTEEARGFPVPHGGSRHEAGMTGVVGRLVQSVFFLALDFFTGALRPASSPSSAQPRNASASSSAASGATR